MARIMQAELALTCKSRQKVWGRWVPGTTFRPMPMTHAIVGLGGTMEGGTAPLRQRTEIKICTELTTGHILP